MLILVYIAIIILSLLTRNKKWNWIIYALVLCLLLWTSDGTYTDFKGYYDIFERINAARINVVGATPGWFLLCRFFGVVRLNYYGMSLALAFISCFLLHKLFLEFEANENIIWSALCIFPLLINGIQVRFFFAMSIVTYGLKFLIFNHKFAWVKFCACVLIATSVHSAAAIFIILILALIYEKFSFRQNMLITIFVLMFTFIEVQIIPKLAKVYLYQSQYERYITNSHTTTSFKWTLAIIICWLMTLLLFEILICISPIESWKRYKEIRYNIIFKRIRIILFLLGLTLPLLIYDRNFHRFIQLGYILDAVALGIYWKSAKNKYDSRIKRLSVYVLFAVLLIPAIYSYEFVPVNAIAPLFQIIGFPSIFT